MKRGAIIAIALAGAVGGIIFVAAASKAANAPPAPKKTNAPPWLPSWVPSSPSLIKSRDTSVTTFPIDVYSWPAMPVAPGVPSDATTLAVASDDPTSFVAYDAVTKTVYAQGPGKLTAQIVAQI